MSTRWAITQCELDAEPVFTQVRQRWAGRIINVLSIETAQTPEGKNIFHVRVLDLGPDDSDVIQPSRA